MTYKTKNTPIIIFSDSQKALTDIRKANEYIGSLCLRKLIYQKTNNLTEQEHPITIFWIPNHFRLIKHDKVNKSTKNKAHRGGKPTK